MKTLLAAAAASLFLVACAQAPTRPQAANDARDQLAALQADPNLANRAPVQMKDAQTAVHDALAPQEDPKVANHLAAMAVRKVEIAKASAQTDLLEEQRKAFGEQRDAARLTARTQEADTAKMDAQAAQVEAARAHGLADIATRDADATRQANEALAAQVAALNAQATDRGLVITLGDVLFATGKSDLQGDATGHLAKLAAFLNQYPTRSAAIEGYTDNVGGESYNISLSQRRADAVKSYLMREGVNPGRLSATGKGEESPVAGNDSATGRQQNRRVEVIVANAVTSSQ